MSFLSIGLIQCPCEPLGRDLCETLIGIFDDNHAISLDQSSNHHNDNHCSPFCTCFCTVHHSPIIAEEIKVVIPKEIKLLLFKSEFLFQNQYKYQYVAVPWCPPRIIEA